MDAGPLVKTTDQHFQLRVPPDLKCFDGTDTDNVWANTDLNKDTRLLGFVCDDPFYIPDLCSKASHMIKKVVLGEGACGLRILLHNVLCPVLLKSETCTVVVSCLKLLFLNLPLCEHIPESVWVRCISSRHSMVQSCFFNLVRKWLKATRGDFVRGAHPARFISRNIEKIIDVCVGGKFFPRVHAMEALRLSRVQIPHDGMQRLHWARSTITSSGPGQALAIAHAVVVLQCGFPIGLTNLELMFRGFTEPEVDVGLWGELAQRAITSVSDSKILVGSVEGACEQTTDADAVMLPIACQAWRRILSVHRNPVRTSANSHLYISIPVWEAGVKFAPSLVCDFIREASATGALCQTVPRGAVELPVYALQKYMDPDLAHAHLREFIGAHVDALANICQYAASNLQPAQCGVDKNKLEQFKSTAEVCVGLLQLTPDCGGVGQDSEIWKCRHEAKAFVGLMFNILHLQSSIACELPYCKCFDSGMVSTVCKSIHTLLVGKAMRLDCHTLALLEQYVTSEQVVNTICRSKQLSRKSVTELAGLYESFGDAIWELEPQAHLSAIKGCLGLLALAQETDPYGCFVLGPVSRKVRSCLRSVTHKTLCSVPDVCAILASAAARGSISRIESVFLASTLSRCHQGERLLAKADKLLHYLASPFQGTTPGSLTVAEKRSTAREERLFVSLFREGGEGRKRDVADAQLDWGLIPPSNHAKASPANAKRRR
jgi:hypothetical protein